MYPYPQSQLVVGSVPDLEGFDLLQQRQRHPGDLSGVQLSIPYWQPRHHHVGITDGLHLEDEGRELGLTLVLVSIS